MKNYIFTVFFKLIGLIAFGCPQFLFHVTHGGSAPLTFRIEDINNPSGGINVLSTATPDGRYSVSAWAFNGTLGHPCGVTFGSNICYKITCTTGPSDADYLIIKFNGLDPNQAKFDYDVVSGTFSQFRPGNASAYIYAISKPSQMVPLCANCYTMAYILDNYLFHDGVNGYNPPVPAPNFFATPFLETHEIIIIENSTISATSTVRLDANPLTGSIQLLPGFSTQPGAIFIAQTLDGCGPLIPQ